MLLERAPRFREGGYVIDLWGLGFDVAERMGLLPVLRERGYAIDHLRNVNAEGQVRTELSAAAIRSALGDRFLSILRGDLARAIYDQVEGKVEALYGDGIRALHDDGAGLEVELESGARRRFDMVVACDGLHSTVRPWSRGRVLLAGDAAHCPSLLAGAGCAFAMAGAYILAGELQRAQGDASTAFATYERIYRPFIEAQQKAARGFAGAFAPRSRFAIFARDQAMRLLNLPGLAVLLLREPLTDALGFDPRSGPGLSRWAGEVLDVYGAGLRGGRKKSRR